MIGYAHIEALREQVARAERELAGWRNLLTYAEQADGADRMPNPAMQAGQAWPTTAPPAWQPPVVPVAGRDPYPVTSVLPPIDGSELPANQAAAFEAFHADHDVQAQAPKEQREREKWQAS